MFVNKCYINKIYWNWNSLEFIQSQTTQLSYHFSGVLLFRAYHQEFPQKLVDKRLDSRSWLTPQISTRSFSWNTNWNCWNSLEPSHDSSHSLLRFLHVAVVRRLLSRRRVCMRHEARKWAEWNWKLKSRARQKLQRKHGFACGKVSRSLLVTAYHVALLPERNFLLL